MYKELSHVVSLLYRHIADNLVQYMPAALMSSDVLPALTQLYMMNNQLTFLQTGTFTNLTTLLHL